MNKISKIALSLLGMLPVKTLNAQELKNIHKELVGAPKSLNLNDLQLTAFHNLVLPDRTKGMSIDDAWNNFSDHFPNHSDEEKDLVFQRYLDQLILSKKIVIDSTYTLRGNESGLTKEK